MFRILTTRLRRRAGWWLALAYLGCVIAPPLGLTFADAAAAAHCLIDDYHMVAPVHVHADAAAHQHGAAMVHDHGGAAHHGAQHGLDQKQTDSKGSKSKSSPAECCGMFCMTAATSELAIPNGPAPRTRAVVPMLAAALGGVGPHRIDRPPIVLASV